MNEFSLGTIRNASVWGIYRMREKIDIEPDYQREGDVWSQDKRFMLIDTIINGFDVPKIYMHKFPEVRDGIEYALIDGKQRLSTMWSFIKGEFALPSDFVYIKDPAVSLAGFKYSDIAREQPDIKSDFDAYELDVVTITTNEIELIEDMFSRLNEAVPLNAAEKRNALAGPLPVAVRELIAQDFFTNKLPFSNKRYRHLDIAAKMLFLTSKSASVIDTKKAYVDQFFKSHAKSDVAAIQSITTHATHTVTTMSTVFTDKDPLLRSVGMVMLYYILFEKAIEVGIVDQLTRPSFIKFDNQRKTNRASAALDIAEANYDLLEFDRFTQSPNDAIALRFRLGVIDRMLFGGKLGFTSPDVDAIDPSKI